MYATSWLHRHEGVDFVDAERLAPSVEGSASCPAAGPKIAAACGGVAVPTSRRPLWPTDLDPRHPSMPTSDGAGVKLRRSLGSPARRCTWIPSSCSTSSTRTTRRLPRGLSGASASRLRDRHLHARRAHAPRGSSRQSRRPGPGDVQWMTAARGIIHSEMPQQSAGTHARIPAVAQLAAKRKDEAGRLPRHPGARDPVMNAAGWRRGEGYRRHPGV